MYTSEDLRLEDEVVWLESPEDLDYIRERFWLVADPYEEPPQLTGGDRMIAYSVLVPGLKYDEKCYLRRYFDLKPTDRDSDPNDAFPRGYGCCPSEAVDPDTVVPGHPGRKTSRCIDGTYSRFRDKQKRRQH